MRCQILSILGKLLIPNLEIIHFQNNLTPLSPNSASSSSSWLRTKTPKISLSSFDPRLSLSLSLSLSLTPFDLHPSHAAGGGGQGGHAAAARAAGVARAGAAAGEAASARPSERARDPGGAGGGAAATRQGGKGGVFRGGFREVRGLDSGLFEQELGKTEFNWR